MQKLTLVFCLALILTACGKEPVPAQQGLTVETGTTTLSRSVLKYADHEGRNKNARKKYVLVAGGRDDANFAQEVVDQRKALLALNVPASEIACFYSIPFDHAFKEDETQYRALAEDLKPCYPAYPKYIWEQLQDGGVAEDFLYFYVTSHGMPPLSVGLKKYNYSAAERAQIQGWLDLYPSLDQFMVSVDALEDGEPTNLAGRVERLKSNNYPIEDLFFSPRHLKKALLSATRPATKKFVVVQACYSGGFIDSDEAESRKDALTDLDNVTIMSAARYDRSSFGCGAGFHRTYFGGAFIDKLAMEQKKRLPQEADWGRLYNEVRDQVVSLEQDFYEKLSPEKQKTFRGSDPMFFTSP